jgi:succinate dehydrogenase / fumarate reductase, cytochrome b subunit
MRPCDEREKPMKTAADQFSQSRAAVPSIAVKHPPKKQEQSVAIQRPLSPFMFPTWYRFQITSVLSIVHRFTGIVLAAGSILLAWWLVAVAAGGEVFRETHAFIASPIGLLLLFCWSAAFFYHLCSGIRHLFWDAGYGFEIRSAYRSGYVVLAATVVLTAFAWLYVFLG